MLNDAYIFYHEHFNILTFLKVTLSPPPAPPPTHFYAVILTFLSFKILRALCLKSKSQNSCISLGQIGEKSICFYAFLTCLIVHGTAKHVYTTLPLEYSYLFFSVLSKVYANTTDSNLKRSSSNIEIVYLFSSSENRWQIILRKKAFIYLFIYFQ